MADVTYTYIPADGDTLVPADHNLNVFSTSNGQSVNGELNGGLEAANFAAGFTVRPEHIKPFETYRFVQEGGTTTLDFSQDLYAPQNLDTQFVQIPGTGSRIYLPHNQSAVMYRCSMFVTVFRMRENLDDQAVAAGPQIFLRMFIDGQSIQSTSVTMPETYRANTAAANDFLIGWERQLTRQYDFTYLSISGSDSYNTAGWHSMAIRCKMTPNDGSENLNVPFDYDPAATKIDYPIKHRVRFGIRNSRIIGYL